MQRRKKRKTRQLYIKIVFWLIVGLALVNIIGGVTAKYSSTANSSAQVDLAFYLLKEQSLSQSLNIDNILPSSSSYSYTFSVANYYGQERTQTALDYSMQLVTTTNLPLTYVVHKQGQATNLITNTSTNADSDGTYFKTFTIQGDEFGFSQDEQVVYVLEVTFPDTEKHSEYKGTPEYVQLTVDSRQKISNNS